MIKMQYPVDTEKVRAMNDGYFNNLSVILGNITAIDNVLIQIKMLDGSDLTCKKLIVASFEELFALNDAINKLTPAEKIILEPIRNYHGGRPVIAKFFMEQQELMMSSCYYCNIDSIYAFSKMADYWGPLDFIQRADLEQLKLIENIGEKKAKKILSKRAEKQFEKLEDCPVTPAVLENIKLLNYNPTHNHFTLDHFYHQEDFEYLKLCLYNFIPCCYVCNSKFKNKFKLYVTNPGSSSPSSASYSFHNDVQFKVYFLDSSQVVSTFKDFSVDLEISANHDSHTQYLNVLRLRGRYVHHKRIALRLMQLKAQYPQERLEELSLSLNISVEEVKRLAFGPELFDKDYDNNTLIKYKRDVAKSIRLM